MFSDRDVAWLIELGGTWPMTNGWTAIIRAEWCDVTNGRPHGLSYALVLNDKSGQRLLGFDNSHGYDGADDEDPFDHEHRFRLVGQRFRYDFRSPSELLSDFLDRVARACEVRGVRFEFCGEIGAK